MATVKVGAAIRLVEAAGWVTISGKPSDDLPPGTWASIKRQAGL